MNDAHGLIRQATEASIAAARHLGPMDSAAVAALRELADRLDAPNGKMDNVLAPTFLKYCNDLGLTPSGRVGIGRADDAASTGSKLAQLRALAGGA